MGKPRSTLLTSKRVHAGVTASPQYLTGLDIFHSFAFFPLVMVYKKGFDLDVLERALAETLKHYPIVAGRYKKDAKGHIYVDCNDAGVDFRVHRWPGAMPYSEAHRPVKDMGKFYKLVLPWQSVGKDISFIQVNVHQYDDEGVVLCVYATHSLFDGASFWTFMLDWSKACRGLEIKTPFFDRSVIVEAGKSGFDDKTYELMVSPPLLSFVGIMARLGWQAITGIKNDIFRISPEAVQMWKSQVKAELPDTARVSTASLVTAYIMKAISPVMPHGVERSVGVILDLRYIRGLGLPREFFGNALCYAEARYTEQALAEGRLPVLAEQCKAAPEQISVGSLRKMLATAEAFLLKGAIWRLLFKPTVETLRAGLIQNNWLQLPIFELDMGRGTPTWFEMMPATIRMVVILQTPQKDGGLDLILSAPRVELDALRASFAADGIETALAPRTPTSVR